MTGIGKYFSYSEFSQFITDALKDSSYKVVARAFKIISDKDVTKAKGIAIVLEKDSSDVVFSRLSEYYSTSTEDKTEFYKRAMSVATFFGRYQVIKDFTKYLNENTNTDIVSAGTDILIERAKRLTSKRFHTALINSLKEIESSIKKKISDGEDELVNIKDSTIKIEKEAALSNLKIMRNKLHEKIIAIDK